MLCRPKKRVFLFDGHALAYRAHYAMLARPLRTTAGESTSVPWGITRFLRKVMVEHAPEYLAFVLDAGRGDTFRHALFAAYKATRDKLGEADAGEFQRSMRRVRQILDALRIPVVQIEGYEADDVIGTLAVQAVRHGLQAVIVSGDTDFYQLIGPDVAVLEPGRQGRAFIEPQWVDAEAATRRLGVPPEHVVDYLGLVGDPSDNVPGARGIGPKTAAPLVERWGSVEAILEHVEELEPARARTALREHADEVRLSKDLVTLRTDVPVDLDLGALRAREPDRDRLRDLFVELEFHTLLHEFAPAPAQPHPCEILDDVEAVRIRVREIERAGCLALEIVATDEEGPRSATPVGIALATDDGRTSYLPLDHETRTLLPSLGSSEMVVLRRLLASIDVTKVGHGLAPAMLSLRAAGVEMGPPVLDTKLAAYCLDPTRRQYELEPLLVEYLGHRLPDDSEGHEAPSAGAAARRVADPAARRAEAALQLADALVRQLDVHGQRSLFEHIEMPLVPVLADMQWTGIGVDRAVFEALGVRLDTELERLTGKLYELAGESFNPDSPIQLRSILFEKLGLPVKKRTKTGPSTDADVLSELALEGHELPSQLLEYRELAKLRSTYVEGLLARIDPRTGRLHTTFNQTATATGRLSSSDPNLQNIPIRSELAAWVRRGFVAAPGSVLLEADHSQIELRVLAHLSRDPVFVEAFRSGRDIHSETAAHLFGGEATRLPSELRELAKMVNYATVYGQTAWSLAHRLGMSLQEAQAFIDGYFVRFPAIRSFLDAQVERARRDGYVETLFGRRRYVPQLRSRNPRVEGFGRRVAYNTPIQGTAADLVKIAMIRIHDRLCKETGAHMLLQVHDELLFEVPEPELGHTTALVREEMTSVAHLEVPLVVHTGTGHTWHDATVARQRESRPEPPAPDLGLTP